MKRISRVLFWVCTAMSWAPSAGAAVQADVMLEAVDFDQRLDATVPLELDLRDEFDRPVRLGDYAAAGPVILLLAYYRCPNLCGLALEGLAESLKHIAFRAGSDYQVVALSIDPRETPSLAAGKKAGFAARYPTIGIDAGWHFLTGGEAQIRRLASSVGFRYRYDAGIDQYAHPTGIVLLTRQGQIARYLYGIQFADRDLRLGLVETAGGRIGSPVDQLLLRCYAYDPATGRYGMLVTRVLQFASAVTVMLLGGFVGLMLLRERRRTRRSAAPVTGNG